MTVDEPTLLLALGLASLSASGVFFALTSFSKEIPGVRYWGIGSLGVGLALVIHSPHVITDWRLASLFSNIPFSVGLAFMLAGTMQFCRRPLAVKVLWVFSVLAIVVTITFTFIVVASRWRISILIAYQTTIKLWMAMILWRYPDPYSRKAFQIASAASLLEACTALIQGVLVAVSSSQITFASPELPLANLIAWGGAYLNCIVGNAMLFVLLALRLVNELRRVAERDALTDLLNRRGMRLHFDVLLQRQKHDLRSIGIMFLDIDHFKAINDTYGHDVGDKVLRVMGDVLRRTSFPGATACRWGGEEFCIVVENPTRDSLVDFAEKIRRKFHHATASLAELSAGQTVSIGIASAMSNARFDIATIISVADAQLYQAKRSGRDRVAIAE
ncbi:MAG TPA: GGDEF domain-containing protein [Thermosynechococcaceae cyanobacterium]